MASSTLQTDDYLTRLDGCETIYRWLSNAGPVNIIPADSDQIYHVAVFYFSKDPCDAYAFYYRFHCHEPVFSALLNLYSCLLRQVFKEDGAVAAQLCLLANRTGVYYDFLEGRNQTFGNNLEDPDRRPSHNYKIFEEIVDALKACFPSLEFKAHQGFKLHGKVFEEGLNFNALMKLIDYINDRPDLATKWHTFLERPLKTVATVNGDLCEIETFEGRPISPISQMISPPDMALFPLSVGDE